MRRFYLQRKEDPTGMSGIGRIADGIEFDNGQVAMTWKKEFPSVTVFQSISTVEKLHTHRGIDPTHIVWVDDLHENIEAKGSKLKQQKLEELQDDIDKEEVKTKITKSKSKSKVKKEIINKKE